MNNLPHSSPPTPLNLVTTDQIQKYLEENKNLIMAILDTQQKGKVAECAQYQAILQKNLMYLAAIADAQPQPQNNHLLPGCWQVPPTSSPQMAQHQQHFQGHLSLGGSGGGGGLMMQPQAQTQPGLLDTQTNSSPFGGGVGGGMHQQQGRE